MKVTLTSHTDNPLRAIGIAIATMKEKDPIAHVDSLDRKGLEEYVGQMFKTKLRGSLEFANFTFLVEGVTRAFTHQLVRHRTMSFSQQSLRFFKATDSGFLMPEVEKMGKGAEYKQLINSSWETTIGIYNKLIEEGCPAEDARSILPTNVLTAISFSSSYRGLVDLAEIRLCLQTQSEFRNVMRAIKREIKKVDEFLAEHLIITCQRTGVCPFKSIFDRYCPVEKSLPKVRERLKAQGMPVGD